MRVALPILSAITLRVALPILSAITLRVALPILSAVILRVAHLKCQIRNEKQHPNIAVGSRGNPTKALWCGGFTPPKKTGVDFRVQKAIHKSRGTLDALVGRLETISCSETMRSGV